MSGTEPTPDELVNRFLTHLRVERGVSRNTLRAYSADLQRYLEWAERSHIDPLTLTHRKMRLYLGELDRAGYARRTVSRRLSSVRSLFAYLVAEGLTTSDPSSVLSTPKIPVRLPKVIPADVLKLLLEAPDDSSVVGIRDRAVLELLYATGARVSEISSLGLADIDLAQGQIVLMGKGSKQRIVPVHRVCVNRLRAYILSGRPALAKTSSDSHLFLSIRGLQLSSDAIRRLFAKYVRTAGGTAGLSPHAMRHTFASHLVEAGADLRTVQELLGHVALSTTQIYTHLSMKRLQDVHSHAHPRA